MKESDVALDNLQTPASGNFHLLNKALSKLQVKTAFDTIIEKAGVKEEKRQIRQKRILRRVDYWASFICVSCEAAPSFLPNSNLLEKTFGFFLVIEVEIGRVWYIGIFKKGVAGIDKAVESWLKRPSRRSFSRAFADGGTYQKLSLKRMTASKHELLGASYEAANLKTTLPTLGVTRSVPRSIRIRHGTYGMISITPGTFRIQKSGGRCGIDALADLVIIVAKEIRKSRANEFLDLLPQEIDFSEKPKTLQPIGVLIEIAALLDADDIEIWLKKKTGRERKVDPKCLLSRIGGALDAKRCGNEWDLINDDERIVGRLKETGSGYSFGNVIDQSIEVKQTEKNPMERCRFTTWINRNELFRVVFSKPEYFYSGGQLYKRKGLDSDIDLVRRAMCPCSDLESANSEKGEPKTVDTQFPVDSIFRIVEDSILNNSDYLWCSDLGDEWADYISLRDEAVVFAHCKYSKKTTLGASGYQEVVAQAIKNLGNVRSTPEEFSNKIKAAESTQTWGNTKIKRLRTRRKAWSGFQGALTERISSIHFAREVQLIINMLSVKEFDEEKEKPIKRACFTQLVWLLSAFINSCRELGAVAKIICKD